MFELSDKALIFVGYNNGTTNGLIFAVLTINMAPMNLNLPIAPALLLLAEWALCIGVYLYTIVKFGNIKTWNNGKI